MKRRNFILLSLAAAGAAALPLEGCGPAKQTPDVLSRLCDENTMREIGLEYLRLHPQERNRDYLEKMAPHDDMLIRNEFQNGKIVVVKGWVLSIAEARQCALLTL